MYFGNRLYKVIAKKLVIKCAIGKPGFRAMRSDNEHEQTLGDLT
jgi:hypothetical protein